MASVTISGLPSTSSVDPTNAAIPVTNSGTTYKATPNVLIGSALGAPPAIGNLTPNAGSFTTMTISSTFTLSGGQLIPVANGGTGSGTAAGARTNLGLGSMATQSASAVSITGGSVDGVTIGGNNPAGASFTSVGVNSFLSTPIIQPKNTTGIQFEDASNNVMATFGDNNTLNTTISPANGTVTLSPSGTGNVVIAPAGSLSTLDNVTIGGTTPRAGTFGNIQANTAVYTNLIRPSGSSTLSFYNSLGTTQLSIAAGGGVNLTGNRPVSISPVSSTGSVTINPFAGGNMDKVVIGATTPVNATFNTLTANSTVNLSPDSSVVNISPTGSVGGVIIDPEAGGTLDNVLIGGTTPLGATVTDLTATGTINLSGKTVTIAPLGAGEVIINPATLSYMDNVVIGFTTPTVARFSSVSTTTGQISTTPTNGNDIANKSYVDSVAQGLNVKAACVVATTANLTSLSGLLTIDGVTVSAGNRVLVKNQTTSSQNGIYNASATTWTRSSDMNTWSEVVEAFTFIESGTLNANTGWVCTAQTGGTIDVTPMPWVQFSGAGTYTAGTGLTLTGSQFSITNTAVTAGGYGNASSVSSITVNAQGQITAAKSQSIIITLSQVSDAGTIASQDANAVTITGGTIDNTSIGATTPADGSFTTAHVNFDGSSRAYGSLNVGVPSPQGSDTGIIASYIGDQATYLQSIMQNTNDGNTAYTTFSVLNDTGFSNYGDFGVNSSTYSYSANGYPNNALSLPNATYLESYGGDLSIGTWQEKAVHLIANAAVNTADALTVNTDNTVTIPTIKNNVTFIKGGATGGGELLLSINDVAGVVSLVPSVIGSPNSGALIVDVGDASISSWTFSGGDLFPSQGATNMTNGFVFIPAAAGPPTGTPTVATGTAPLYYDTTDGALYAYNSAWQSINLQPNQLEARAAPMTIATTTDTAVLWTTVDVNGTKLTYASGKWTNSSSRALTVIISTTVAWDNVAGGARVVYITRNGDSTTGTNRMAEFDVDAGATDFDVQNVNTTIALQPGDYFQVWVWQNSGSNVGIGNASGGMSSGYSVRLQATVL